MSNEPLPHFERPPVVETVLGVQFNPLPRFRNCYLGAFWKTLGEGWPNVADAPLIEPQFEEFGAGQGWADVGIHLRFSKAPGIRLQITSAAKDRMIQVQNGRLHYNWTGYLGGEYPRYTAIKPEFQDCWGRFQEFIKSEELGVPSPNQWEITYVNQIDKETLWTGPQDWGDVLTLLAATPQTSMVELANLSAKWHFEMPGQRGRLHVQVDLGRRADPSGHPKEVIVLQLTARGPIRGDVSLEHGLDIGREAIVRTFADITSVKAHQFWRKTDVAP